MKPSVYRFYAQHLVSISAWLPGTEPESSPSSKSNVTQTHTQFVSTRPRRITLIRSSLKHFIDRCPFACCHLKYSETDTAKISSSSLHC